MGQEWCTQVVVPRPVHRPARTTRLYYPALCTLPCCTSSSSCWVGVYTVLAVLGPFWPSARSRTRSRRRNNIPSPEV